MSVQLSNGQDDGFFDRWIGPGWIGLKGTIMLTAVSTLRSSARAALLACTGALLVAGGAMFGVQGPGAGATTASPGAVPSASLHMVPAVLAGLPLATLEGPAPSSTVMEIGVSLQRPNTAGEIQLYNDMYDPSSALYHQFLTTAQFNNEFGVPAAQTSAVRSWLTSGGVSILTSSAGGDYFTAAGTVAQLDKLFSVSIGSYTFEGVDFLANSVPPSVPVNLPIDAVTGLDNVRQFSLSSLTSLMSKPSTPAVGIQPGTEQILTPQDLWGIYNDPGASALTNPTGNSTESTIASTTYDLGQGQTTGIFGEGETSSVLAQLRLFEGTEGFPKVPVRTIDTEGGPATAYGDNEGAIEWELDSQAVTGMAPDLSQLDFYFAKSLYDADIFEDFDYWANDPNGPRQMNASFGECEENPSNPATGPLAQDPWGTEFGDDLEAIGDPMLRQASMEGRTLFTAAGDSGSGCFEIAAPGVGAVNGYVIQPVPMVLYPCDSVYAVCVGGTVVSSNGSTYPESAQRDDETSWTYSGGGSSYFVPEASYQVGVANIDHPCLSTPSGDPYPPGTEPICRGVPDVADLSGNVLGDAYFIYIDGVPSSEGGTSLASPLMAGQWTRIQAGAPAKVQRAGGLGFANPTIYKQASSADSCSGSPTATAAETAACTSSTYARDFYNVTTSEFGVGNGAYQPGPGWNYASGWGSLNVGNFIADVDGDAAGTAVKATGPAAPAAKVVATADLYGPPGWATDPIDDSALVPSLNQPAPIPGDNENTNDDPALDITGATLSATTSAITATISGPDIGSTPPASSAPNGISFYVAWSYDGTVYYAQANESMAGAWTYSSGSTAGGAYNDTASSAATGTEDTDAGTVTIVVPTSEVGSPPAGALLTDPQAFDHFLIGNPDVVALGVTADSVDDVVPPSLFFSNDCAKSTNVCGVDESKGLAVQVS
jgi:pseudomonalisin